MTALVPPGGWAFYQEGFEKPIGGSNYEDLIAQVIGFRVKNKLTLGNPPQEVENQLCERYPAQCNPHPVDPLSTPPFVPKTLHDRVASWAANRYQQAGSINYVPQEEAERRASICASCPQNELNWMNTCPPCREDVQRTLLLLRQNNRVSDPTSLGACRIAGHDNHTVAFLPERLIRHRVRVADQLPSSCWMNELSAK